MRWLLTGEGAGTDAPGDDIEVPQDFSEILRELHDLREDMRAQAERAARLEKKLRRLLQEPAE
jgi:hypothetical protein